MPQQILVIHGGTMFNTYEEFLAMLQNKPLTLDDLRAHVDWKSNLQQSLGKDFDVLLPSMPNKNNVKYHEWKIWFERMISLIDERVIMIGHSLGGIFLAKYLAENTCTKTIKAVMFVAPPFDSAHGESFGDFTLPQSLSNITNNCKHVYFFYSKDDPTVPFEELQKYQRALPNARAFVFENRGHFRQESFPELVELIKSLSL